MYLGTDTCNDYANRYAIYLSSKFNTESLRFFFFFNIQVFQKHLIYKYSKSILECFSLTSKIYNYLTDYSVKMFQ